MSWNFTSDSQPYELTARAAAQDLCKPDILELRDISALVKLKDGQRVTIKSINGVYNTKGDVLALNDQITLNSTSGYEALSQATVNTASGYTVSESPVEVKLPNNGLIRANHFELMENGALIFFCALLWRRRRDDTQSGPDTTRSATLSTSGAPAQVSVRPSNPPVPTANAPIAPAALQFRRSAPITPARWPRLESIRAQRRARYVGSGAADVGPGGTGIFCGLASGTSGAGSVTLDGCGSGTRPGAESAELGTGAGSVAAAGAGVGIGTGNDDADDSGAGPSASFSSGRGAEVAEAVSDNGSTAW